MPQSYRQLTVWKKSMALVAEVYQASQGFPGEEVFGLTGQLRQAAVAIAGNIAQGEGRDEDLDLLRFLTMAKGNVAELETLLEVAVDLGYLTGEKAGRLRASAKEVGRMLSSLIVIVAHRKKGQGIH